MQRYIKFWEITITVFIIIISAFCIFNYGYTSLDPDKWLNSWLPVILTVLITYLVVIIPLRIKDKEKVLNEVNLFYCDIKNNLFNKFPELNSINYVKKVSDLFQDFSNKRSITFEKNRNIFMEFDFLLWYYKHLLIELKTPQKISKNSEIPNYSIDAKHLKSEYGSNSIITIVNTKFINEINDLYYVRANDYSLWSFVLFKNEKVFRIYDRLNRMDYLIDNFQRTNYRRYLECYYFNFLCKKHRGVHIEYSIIEFIKQNEKKYRILKSCN